MSSMKRRKRALVDVDGVLADFMTPALEVVRIVSGVAYDINEFNSMHIFDHVPKQYEDACYERYGEKGFCSKFQPYPEALDGLLELGEYYDVYALTSPMRSPTWVYERSEWLIKYCHIPKRRQIFTSAKYAVTGELFIDDHPENLEKWSAENPNGMPVLWDQPYNRQSLAITRPWIRAKEWEHVIRHAQLSV